MGLFGTLTSMFRTAKKIVTGDTKIGYDAYTLLTNTIKRLPGIRRLNLPERSFKKLSGEGFTESPLSKRELRTLRQTNNGLIRELRNVEDKWNETEALVWGGKEVVTPIIPPHTDLKKGIVGQILFYRDRAIINREISIFSKNDKFRITNLLALHKNNEQRLISQVKDRIKRAHGNKKDSEIESFFRDNIEEIRNQLRATLQFRLDPELVNLFPELGYAYETKDGEIQYDQSGKAIIKRDGTGREIWAGEENIYPLGWRNWEYLRKAVVARFTELTNLADAQARVGQFNPGTLALLTNSRETLKKVITAAYGRDERGDTIGLGERSHYEFLTELQTPYNQMETIREDLLKKMSEVANIRFNHTFKVLRPFIKIPVKKMVHKTDKKGELLFDKDNNAIMDEEEVRDNLYLKDATHPKWEQTQWEIEAGVPHGYDENGYPLEINDNGEVLLDKWWHEISQNPWQISGIADKPGGDEMLKRIEWFSNEANCRIVDKKWADDAYGDPYLDIVDMGTYMYVQYDTLRDDLRDGRHHPWSKTAYDYLVASMGGFDVAPNVGYSLARIEETSRIIDAPRVQNVLDKFSIGPDMVPRRIEIRDRELRRLYEGLNKLSDKKLKLRERELGILSIYLSRYRSVMPTMLKRIIPTQDTGTPFYNETQDYVKARPDFFFENITEEERLVVRNYKMRLIDPATGKGGRILGEFNPQTDKIRGEEDKLAPIFGTLIRRPTHANTAFDRRANKRKGKFIHWGRMLYYEGPDGVNRWSENPFPHISSRGLAQYIRNRALIGLYSYEDQKRTVIDIGEAGYDFGVRRPIVGGSQAVFPRDIIGGSDVVQPGKWGTE